MDRVLCFGEVLWDLPPGGRFLGGAPLNVAYHLAKLGAHAILGSSVGRDTLGDLALAEIRQAGIDARYVTRHDDLSTGTAEVTLDASGQARYRLPHPVAWDDISILSLMDGADPAAIVYGTLALRGDVNRLALRTLLDANPKAWRVCDLNLRPPFDDLEPLRIFIRRADLLKLNADEARRLTGSSATDDNWKEMTLKLCEQTNARQICITLGGEGACMRDGELWFHVTAPAVDVCDTIGAGDAFTAALIAGRLRGGSRPDWTRHLHVACQVGAYVASQRGAQPAYGNFRPIL